MSADNGTTARPHGAEVITRFIAHSPFAQACGIEVTSIEDDRAELTMPFRSDLATLGELVHGGAVSALADTAAMAASWATPEPPENLRGTTVGLTVEFLAGASGCDLVADARVIRRGSLCRVEVDIHGDGTHVAKALATYKLG